MHFLLPFGQALQLEFVDGFVDIVERAPNQDRINLLSAYCCISLRGAPHATPEANRLRQDIAEAADWLIRKHLREVQPMIWAHAAAGFDNDAQVASLRLAGGLLPTEEVDRSLYCDIMGKVLLDDMKRRRPRPGRLQRLS